MGSFAFPDIQSHQIFGLQHSYIALDPAQPLQRNASPKGRRIEASTVIIIFHSSSLVKNLIIVLYREEEEEIERRENEKRERKERKKEQRKRVQYEEKVGGEDFSNSDNEKVKEESVFKLPKNANQIWTDVDLAKLAKLIRKYPPGTLDRWERIAEILERLPTEVTKMANKIKSNAYMVPVSQGAQGLTGN